MEYPDYLTYRILYARYFKPERLAKLMNRLSYRGKVVLDLCCGEGGVTLEALRRGASWVFAIDGSQEMFSPEILSQTRVTVMHTPVESLVSVGPWQLKRPHTVICQQAINYWLTRKTAEQIHDMMEPDGIFAFNTFVNRPSSMPRTMSYEFDGRQYWECSQLCAGEMVHHVQVCERIAPHVTSFPFLSDEAIRKMLDGLFAVSVTVDGASAIYRCRKE